MLKKHLGQSKIVIPKLIF